MPDAVQHSIHVATSLDIEFKVPHAPPTHGQDSIHVTFDGTCISMQRHDWQQLVNCVIKADEQVRTILDEPGRLAAGKVS